MIVASDLSKIYGKKTALHALDLTVRQGSVFGLLGPEGAGKTTVVKLFGGLLIPTQGKCSVMDLSPAKEPAKLHKLCGFVTGTMRLYGHLSGLQNLVFFSSMNGLSTEEAHQRASSLMKRLSIWELRDVPYAQYSPGASQRLLLAHALIHRPQVLFWDEPDENIDTESAEAIADLIQCLHRDEGMTVFFSTNRFSDAQGICTSFGILNRGVLVARGSFEELWRGAGLSLMAELHIKGETPVEGFTLCEGWWRKPIRSAEDMPELLKQVVAGGREVYESRIARPTLEEVYQRYIAPVEVVV